MPSPDERHPIVHFSQDFAPGKPQLGGYSRIYNLCRDGRAHVILTISQDVAAVEDREVDGIRVITLPIPHPVVRRADQVRLVEPVARAAVRALADRGLTPALWFGHSQLFNYFVLARARARAFPATKVLWEANAIWGIPTLPSLAHRLANAWNFALQAIVFHRADAIVFQTVASRDYAIRRFRAPAERCHVVTNAVVLGPPPPPRAPHHPRVVGCIGLFDDLNGVRFLVEALARQPAPPGLRFVFAGKGKHREAVERFCATGPGQYLGTLPFAEMQRRMAELDYLIIPRIANPYADLYIPTKLLEAMAAGVVPICSRVAGMSEVVRDGENGLEFAAEDRAALAAVLARAAAMPEAEHARLAAAARETVQRDYDYAANHAQIAEVYARLLTRSG